MKLDQSRAKEAPLDSTYTNSHFQFPLTSWSLYLEMQTPINLILLQSVDIQHELYPSWVVCLLVPPPLPAASSLLKYPETATLDPWIFLPHSHHWKGITLGFLGGCFRLVCSHNRNALFMALIMYPTPTEGLSHLKKIVNVQIINEYLDWLLPSEISHRLQAYCCFRKISLLAAAL